MVSIKYALGTTIDDNLGCQLVKLVKITGRLYSWHTIFDNGIIRQAIIPDGKVGLGQ